VRKDERGIDSGGRVETHYTHWLGRREGTGQAVKGGRERKRREGDARQGARNVKASGTLTSDPAHGSSIETRIATERKRNRGHTAGGLRAMGHAVLDYCIPTLVTLDDASNRRAHRSNLQGCSRVLSADGYPVAPAAPFSNLLITHVCSA
jgi:hypothetical protein